jgi:nicotinamide-nucleotide amidase
MKAAILAVGSELLGTRRLDTNSLKLTAAFDRFGVELVGKSIVGDDEDAIAGELRRWAASADVVVVSGGLGPTADDVTRAAAARAFDRSISIDEKYVEWMRQRYESYFGRALPEVNRRQAEVISGAEVIRNPRGSAPAQRLETGGATVFLFPAVPFELEGLIGSCLEPWLRERLGEATDGVDRAVFKISSRPESEIEERIAPLYERFGRDGVSVLASPGEVQVHLSVRGPQEERRARLAAMREQLREVAGDLAFTEDEGETLEAVVGRMLAAAGATLTTAESCTGGLLAERLTRVTGSSAYFLGGVVTYSNELKASLLGVDPDVIAAEGAVSEPVARAMAEGVRTRYASDYGAGITGVAGPDGGSEEKPVGTVHVAVAGPAGVRHRRVRFIGDREKIRWQASQLVLEMLRRTLQLAPRVEDV